MTEANTLFHVEDDGVNGMGSAVQPSGIYVSKAMVSIAIWYMYILM